MARDGQNAAVFVDQPEIHLQMGGNVFWPKIGGGQPPAALRTQKIEQRIDERLAARTGFCAGTGRAVRSRQAIDEFRSSGIERQQVAAPALRQRLEQQRHFLHQHAGHQPFAAVGIDLVECVQRHGQRHTIVGSPGLEMVAKREIHATHAQQTWETRLVDAVGVLFQQGFAGKFE